MQPSFASVSSERLSSPTRVTPIRPLEGRLDEEEVPLREAVQVVSAHEDENLVSQMQEILFELRRYKRSVFDRRPFLEAERRILGEMTVVTQQVLGADEFKADM